MAAPSIEAEPGQAPTLRRRRRKLPGPLVVGTSIVVYRLFERTNVESQPLVHSDRAHLLRREAKDAQPLGYRAVGLIAQVDHRVCIRAAEFYRARRGEGREVGHRPTAHEETT